MMDEQAVRAQLEAQVQDILERYAKPQTPEQAASRFAENLRRMGVPAIRAYAEGSMLIADVVEPVGEG
jgi:hypothetical protein